MQGNVRHLQALLAVLFTCYSRLFVCWVRDWTSGNRYRRDDTPRHPFNTLRRQTEQQ